MSMRTMILILTALSLLTSPGGDWPARAVDTNLLQPQNADFKVEFYPVAPYHVSDVLSARVTYTGDDEIGGTEITVALANEPDQVFETATFSQFSQQATLYWFYDTHENDAGFIEFQFSVPEWHETWTDGVYLLPDPENRTAAWSTVHSPCCTLHYLTGTQAEDDLPEIIAALEERSAIARSQFAVAGVWDDDSNQEPLSVVLVPIVVGHGGFATDEAVLTYTQRNWTGIDFEILAHHELVHVIDRLVNTDGPRPIIFVEGIAVYLSGGHYRPGDPLQRAAALLALDMYLPLDEIVDDFYAAQHEIGYMQAAALVAYLDQVLGWEGFIDFYFNLPSGSTDSEIISSALEARLGINLTELEADFITYLETLDRDPQVEADVRLTVETYDLLRCYQTLLIPSAHFQTAWWPPVHQMRTSGLVGDYAYREKAPLNVIIEGYFMDVHAALQAGDYAEAEAAVGKIDKVLTLVENSGEFPSHYTIGWPLTFHLRKITHP